MYQRNFPSSFSKAPVVKVLTCEKAALPLALPLERNDKQERHEQNNVTLKDKQ
jgi:hypothetical protein